MDVVVEDDDPDHDSQAERHRLLAGEPAAVLPEGAHSCVREARAASGEALARYSRRFQHDLTHGRHGAQAVRRVLDGQVLVLGREDENTERRRRERKRRPRHQPPHLRYKLSCTVA